MNLVSFRDFLKLRCLPFCLRSFPVGWNVSVSEEIDITSVSAEFNCIPTVNSKDLSKAHVWDHYSSL